LLGASTTTNFGFNSSDQLTLTLNGVTACTSTAVFRDPTAWMHVVYQQNGSAQTIYVNGSSVATGTTAAAVFNTAIAHQIGAANTTNFSDGYMAEVNFIDGQALTPSSFGQTTGSVWVPKQYAGTYGANGFYLKFNDATTTTTIGNDSSGNANNWTTSGPAGAALAANVFFVTGVRGQGRSCKWINASRACRRWDSRRMKSACRRDRRTSGHRRSRAGSGR
jgi:hypothetical protein